MGFFSWKTQDTNRSISNSFSGRTFPVIMTDDKGNRYSEENYEGYGVFGGKDYYELLAEMNGGTTRDDGIKIAFSKSLSGISEGVVYPSLSECGDWYNGKSPDSCECQGYFYDDEEDDEFYDDSDE